MIYFKTDSAKPRRESQPARWAPGSGPHENNDLYTGHSTQTSEAGVPKGTPKSESEGSHHGSPPGRAPEEQSGGLLMEEYQFNQFNFTTGRGSVQSPL